MKWPSHGPGVPAKVSERQRLFCVTWSGLGARWDLAASQWVYPLSMDSGGQETYQAGQTNTELVYVTGHLHMLTVPPNPTLTNLLLNPAGNTHRGSHCALWQGPLSSGNVVGGVPKGRKLTDIPLTGEKLEVGIVVPKGAYLYAVMDIESFPNVTDPGANGGPLGVVSIGAGLKVDQ